MAKQQESELEKLKRRQERNQRAARAHGLMQGIISMLKPNDIVFECGANIGEVAAPLLETGATVHAFEPDPFAFDKLKNRIGNNANAVLHNVAVGTTTGTINLMRASNFDSNPKGASVRSTVVQGGRNINENEENIISVQQLDLLDFIRKHVTDNGEIAFLKMDIEGAELDILEKMADQNLFDNIRLTVVETHEKKFKELRSRFRAIRERITAEYPITKVNLDWI